MCWCGNVGVERIQKVDSGDENSPAAPAWIWTCNLSVTNPVLLITELSCSPGCTVPTQDIRTPCERLLWWKRPVDFQYNLPHFCCSRANSYIVIIIFMAHHLVRAWSAYKDIRILILSHTHTHTLQIYMHYTVTPGDMSVEWEGEKRGGKRGEKKKKDI